MLGQVIIIIEKSIADLLVMNFMEGKRVYGMDGNSKFVKETINRSIFKKYSFANNDYKSVDLHDKLRIFHNIIFSCINPRPSSSSSDYFNAS